MANEGVEALRLVDAVLAQTAGFAAVAFYAVLDKQTSDGSLDLLRSYATRETRLVVVWAPENQCVVDAYVRGYREALAGGADWILEMDAGFSHDPADLPKFWAAIESGCDCAFGSRFMPGGGFEQSSWKRWLVSWGGSALSNLLLGTKLADMTSGFELFRRDVLEMVLERGIQSRAHFFQTEIKTYCRNLNAIEVPITYRFASGRLGAAPITDSLKQLWRLFRMRMAGKL
jgi:dolichol-phosphate mannosyltransferase